MKSIYSIAILVLVGLISAALSSNVGGEVNKKLSPIAAETGRGGEYHGDGWGQSQQYHYSAYPAHHGHGGIDYTTAILILLVLGAVMCYPMFGGYGFGHGHSRSFGSAQNGSDSDPWSALTGSRSIKDLAGMTEKVVTAVEKLYKTFGEKKA